MRWIGSGILSIILGLTGKFALVGTNSPLALVAVGVVLIIIGIVQIVRGRVVAAETEAAGRSVKRFLWWRITMIAVTGFFTVFLTVFSLDIIIAAITAEYDSFKYDYLDIGIFFIWGLWLIFDVILIRLIVSLVKAVKHNKAETQKVPDAFDTVQVNSKSPSSV
jgi:uncharacterized membrane protein YfcA